MKQTALTYLDSYCERAGHAGAWAEPLNALTNLLFIAAAVLAARALRAQPAGEGARRTDLWLLVAALFCIGLGSGAWHIAPSGYTVLMDVIPITAFINIYLLSALRRLLGWRWRWVAVGYAGYWALTLAAQFTLPPDLLHGTVLYLPTYATLLLLGFALYVRGRPEARPFAVATLVWSLSLAARTLDLELCGWWPYGLHFVWHTLNAWVLWRLLMVLIRPVGAISLHRAL